MSIRGVENTFAYWRKRISLLAFGLMLVFAAYPTSAASDAERAAAKEVRAAQAAAKASSASVKNLERQLQKTQKALVFGTCTESSNRQKITTKASKFTKICVFGI